MFFNRRRAVDQPTIAARIRLSVLEPSCCCRKPVLGPDLKGRPEMVLDVRGKDFESERAAVLQAVDAMQDAYLRVTASALPWPLLAALLSSGERYQILERGEASVEFIVWRFLTAKQRATYLHGQMEYNHRPPDPDLLMTSNASKSRLPL